MNNRLPARCLRRNLRVAARLEASGTPWKVGLSILLGLPRQQRPEPAAAGDHSHSGNEEGFAECSGNRNVGGHARCAVSSWGSPTSCKFHFKQEGTVVGFPPEARLTQPVPRKRRIREGIPPAHWPLTKNTLPNITFPATLSPPQATGPASTTEELRGAGIGRGGGGGGSTKAPGIQRSAE